MYSSIVYLINFYFFSIFYLHVFLSIFKIISRSCGKIELKIISSFFVGWMNPRVFACRNCRLRFEIFFSSTGSMFLTDFLSYNSPESALQGDFCVMESRRMSRGQFLRNFELSFFFSFAFFTFETFFGSTTPPIAGW